MVYVSCLAQLNQPLQQSHSRSSGCTVQTPTLAALFCGLCRLQEHKPVSESVECINPKPKAAKCWTLNGSSLVGRGPETENSGVWNTSILWKFEYSVVHSCGFRTVPYLDICTYILNLWMLKSYHACERPKILGLCGSGTVCIRWSKKPMSSLGRHR